MDSDMEAVPPSETSPFHPGLNFCGHRPAAIAGGDSDQAVNATPPPEGVRLKVPSSGIRRRYSPSARGPFRGRGR